MPDFPFQLSQKQSNALRIATFLATVMVVLRHSFNLHHFYDGGNPWMVITDANIAVQRIFVGITNVAIPAFFFMSGFLFFRDIQSWKDCLPKWQKRINTLLVPYLSWNLLLLVLVLALSLLSKLRPQLHATYGLSYSANWMLDKLTMHPIMGHFWYIRTLIIFLLFAPLLHLLFKDNALSFIVLFILARCWKPIDTGILSTEGMLYFFCGSWMANHGWLPAAYLPRKWLWMLVPIGYSFFIPTLFPCCPSLPGGVAMCMYLGWQICLWLAECPKITAVLLGLNKYSFFLYALHATYVSGMSLLLSRLLPHTPIYSFLTYISCFLATLTLCLAIAFAVKKLLPKAYSFLSGGR